MEFAAKLSGLPEQPGCRDARSACAVPTTETNAKPENYSQALVCQLTAHPTDFLNVLRFPFTKKPATK